jgi:carboxynorspermidine decarboxylase
MFAEAVTPGFVYDFGEIYRAVELLRRRQRPGNEFAILFTLKACAVTGVLSRLADVVNGWAVSSPNELTLATQQMLDNHSLHLASPGLSPSWLDRDRLPDFLSFNSLSQMRRCTSAIVPRSWGLRINPKLSTVDDERYDTCRLHSKLGVSFDEFLGAWNRGELTGITGLHIHNACLSDSWSPLLATLQKIEHKLGAILHEFEWINLGGGYVWNTTTDFGPFDKALKLLTRTYRLRVFVEPGAGIVNAAGYLVASVVDIFESDGKTVAVLDITVNHIPEVFEYQFEPDLVEHVEDGEHEYILAGCSCLAGDVFGEYAFDEPLKVGSRLTFKNVGAYSFSKAHMFNGINLPSIYAVDQSGQLEVVKDFTFDDFALRNGLIPTEHAYY